MKTNSLCAIAAGIFVLAASAVPQAADAAPYFKCASGYSFEVNNAGTGAHCKKQIAPRVKNLICPGVTLWGKRIGTALVIKTGRDKCRGTVTVGGATNSTEVNPLACPTGYTYRQNYSGQRDRCVKPGGLVYKAPVVRFNSN